VAAFSTAHEGVVNISPVAELELEVASVVHVRDGVAAVLEHRDNSGGPSWHFASVQNPVVSVELELSCSVAQLVDRGSVDRELS
jgi:hypothetical protein